MRGSGSSPHITALPSTTPPPHAQPTLASALTLTLSALLLKRPIRRMVVKIGSEESSSILWVHTGGKDCRCRGHKWGGGVREGTEGFLLPHEPCSSWGSKETIPIRLWSNKPKRLPGVVDFLLGSICKGFLFPLTTISRKETTIPAVLEAEPVLTCLID